MISENNNELNAKNENGQPTDGLTEEAVMTVESVADNAFREEFPEGFDELSDEDLIADLEALADELQDFAHIDSLSLFSWLLQSVLQDSQLPRNQDGLLLCPQ